MTDDTIFGKILRGEIPCDEVYSDDRCLAFRDIAPQAPVHVLVIPRKPIESLRSADAEDGDLPGRLLLPCGWLPMPAAGRCESLLAVCWLMLRVV